MIDVGSSEVEVACPVCGFYNSFQLKDIAVETPVICRGCKTLIRPLDDLGETPRALKKINKAFQELAETLKSFGS